MLVHEDKGLTVLHLLGLLVVLVETRKKKGIFVLYWIASHYSSTFVWKYHMDSGTTSIYTEWLLSYSPKDVVKRNIPYSGCYASMLKKGWLFSGVRWSYPWGFLRYPRDRVLLLYQVRNKPTYTIIYKILKKIKKHSYTHWGDKGFLVS